jgi:hypothetical protein
MKSTRTFWGGLTVLVGLGLTAGCGPTATAPKGTAPADKAGAKVDKEDHAHGAGPHGGAIGDWGGGKYHVEFTVDHDTKEATVYILGSNAKKAAPIKAKDGQIAASVTGVKDKETFEVILKAVPQEGDPAGTSSRFVGKHDKIGVVQEFEGTVTGENDGTPYTGKFKEEPPKDKK